MGAAESRMFTTEETLKLINDEAKKTGTDDFWVKVQRRAHPGAHPNLVATLSGANVQHFSSPELWLPQLAGGGKFLLQAFHSSDANRPVGGAMLFAIDGADIRDVDMGLFNKDGDARSADWRGPARLEFPKPQAPPAQVEMPMYGVRTPPGPGSGDSATKSPPAWPRQPGGGVARYDYNDDSPFGGKAAAIEAERRKLEQDKLDVERDRHKSEVAALQKQHDAELKSLKSELLAEIKSAKQPTGPDPAAMMLMEFMKQQAEDRRIAAQQAAEDRRAAAERQDRADARFAQLLEKLTERKERDPLELVEKVTNILGSKKDTGMLEAQTKMMHTMTEMTSQQVGVAMDFVEAAARMQLGGGGEDEPKWLKGVERLVKGVGKMATAATLRQQAQPPPAIPPQLRQPPPQIPPQNARPPQPQPQQQPRPQETQLSVVEQIEQAIRAKYDINAVVNALAQHLEDPSVQAFLEQTDGDFEKAIYAKLGAWVNESPENAKYLQSLFEAVKTKFGITDDEDGDEEGGEEEDAEYEESDEASADDED